MIILDIPGKRQLRIQHLVLDYNGTIAEDGTLIPGVADLLVLLAQKVQVHVITADTFGTCRGQLKAHPVKLSVLESGAQDMQKLNYVQKLGKDNTISIGNGNNDHLMVEASSIGIIVINKEGASVKAISAADLVCNNIHDALGLLINPMRLSASLRN